MCHTIIYIVKNIVIEIFFFLRILHCGHHFGWKKETRNPRKLAKRSAQYFMIEKGTVKVLPQKNFKP